MDNPCTGTVNARILRRVDCRVLRVLTTNLPRDHASFQKAMMQFVLQLPDFGTTRTMAFKAVHTSRRRSSRVQKPLEPPRKDNLRHRGLSAGYGLEAGLLVRSNPKSKPDAMC